MIRTYPVVYAGSTANLAEYVDVRWANAAIEQKDKRIAELEAERDEAVFKAENREAMLEIVRADMREMHGNLQKMTAERDALKADREDQKRRHCGEGGVMSYDKLEDAFARQYEYDLTAAKSRIAELEAEINELRADAERYRWLRVRNELRDDMDLRGPYPVDDDSDGLSSFPTGEELDAAIDQALLIEK